MNIFGRNYMLMTSGSLRFNNKAWCQESVFLKKCIYSVLLVTFYVLFCMDILWIVFASFFCPMLFTFSWIVFTYFFSSLDLFLSFTAEFFRLLLSWYIVNIIYGWISAVFRPSGHTTVIVVFAFSFLFLLLCYHEFVSF